MSCDPIALEAELNLANNAMRRAMRAALKSDFTKAFADTQTGISHAQAALAMCHDDAEHEHPTPTPTPTEPPHEHPTPAPSGDVLASSVVPVPSTFDKAPYLNTRGIQAEGSGGPEGAFRIQGNIGHLNYDDPIVFPGRPGAAHLHMYWGNTRTNAHSTYESLRTTGRSTTEGDLLNRSSYWMPPPLIGDTILLPERITIYYKRIPKGSPDTPVNTQDVVDLPRGIRFITKKGVIRLQKKGGPSYACLPGDDLPAMMAHAASGDVVEIDISFPNAWDGRRVDSPDHMSHVDFGFRHPHTGKATLPDTHPFLITKGTQKVIFIVQEGEDWTKFEFASDRAMGAAPGSTLHADYFEAMDDEIRDEYHENAIQKAISCVAGDLGSGRGLVQPPGWTFNQRPNRIPLSAVPVGGEYRLIG